MPYNYNPSDAYGRLTTEAQRKAAQTQARMGRSAVRGLGATGATADQILRLKSDLNRQGLEQQSDILSGMGLEQANYLAQSQEAAMARDWESDLQKYLQEAGFGYDREKSARERQYAEEDFEKYKKLARNQALWNLGGTALSGLINVGAGLLG